MIPTIAMHYVRAQHVCFGNLCCCFFNMISLCLQELSPTSLSATHPADQSNPGASCLHVCHFAQSVLRLADVKLCCQLWHASRCEKRGRDREKMEGTKETDGERDKKNATFSFDSKS